MHITVKYSSQSVKEEIKPEHSMVILDTTHAQLRQNFCSDVHFV